MKVLRIERLISRGPFASGKEIKAIEADVREAINVVKHPHGSDKFILNNSAGNCNGVTPIKVSCMEYLVREGWRVEHRMAVAEGLGAGPIDATKQMKDGRYFAIEWETGNISSTHRALNKIVLGMIDGNLAGGILIVPSRTMYDFLTDRVGNYREIEPYFPVWRSVTSIVDGVLAVIEIEHDELSPDVPVITKGTDGRALR